MRPTRPTTATKRIRPQANIYPAKVSGPKEFDKCRVMLVENQLRIYKERRKSGSKTGVAMVAKIPYTEATKSGKTWTVATAEGDYTIGQGSGCGCGSPLKYLMPMQLPTEVDDDLST